MARFLDSMTIEEDSMRCSTTLRNILWQKIFCSPVAGYKENNMVLMNGGGFKSAAHSFSI